MQEQLETSAEITERVRTLFAASLQKFVSRPVDIEAMTKTVTAAYEDSIRQLVEKIDPSRLDRVKVTVAKSEEPMSLDITLTGPRDLMEFFAPVGIEFSIPIS